MKQNILNQLKDLVVIEKYSGSKDQFGNLIEQWEVYISCYAKVQLLDNYFWGSEQANQVMDNNFYLIYIRYINNIENKNFRVNFSEKILNIKKIINVENANRVLKIYALEQIS